MKRKYIKPAFTFVAYTHEIAFAARCNFALQSDDCYDLQFK